MALALVNGPNGQGGTAASATSAVYTVTATGAAAGTGLILRIGWRIAAAASQTITSVTDNKGNTWIKEASDNDATSTVKMDEWSVTPKTYISGVTSITVNFSIAATSAWTLWEVSGGDAVIADWGDQFAAAHANSTAPAAGPTATLSQANEFVTAAIAWGSNSATISGLTASYTADTLQTVATAPNLRLQPAHQIVASTTGVSFAGTLSAANRWSNFPTTYREAVGTAVAATLTMAATGGMATAPSVAVGATLPMGGTGGMASTDSAAVASTLSPSGAGSMSFAPQLLTTLAMAGTGAMTATPTLLVNVPATLTIAGLGGFTATAGADFPGVRCTHTVATLLAAAVPAPASAPVPVLSAAAVGTPVASTVPIIQASTVPC